jgi:hypothetical protein
VDHRQSTLHWSLFAAASAISFGVFIAARHGGTPAQTEVLRACGNVLGVIAFIALRRGIGHFVGRPTRL